MAKDKIGRLGMVKEILRKSTNFLQLIIAPVDGMTGVILSYVCPHCNTFLWRTTVGWYPRDTETATTERRSIATGGVRLVEANVNGERPTGCGSV